MSATPASLLMRLRQPSDHDAWDQLALVDVNGDVTLVEAVSVQKRYAVRAHRNVASDVAFAPGGGQFVSVG